MFKDIADDKYLNSAGISSNWLHGRGCYVSPDKVFNSPLIHVFSLFLIGIHCLGW
jgi:hypothetical protein